MRARSVFPALFTLLLLGLYAKLQVFLNDADTGWHIAAGYYYRSKGYSLVDPFSFTTANFHWLNISWLWDEFFSWIDGEGGLYAVALTSAIIAAFMLVFIFRSSIQRSGLIESFIILLIGSFSLMPGFLARPHLLAMLLIFMFYHYTVRYRLWLLPIITLALVNIHGSFIAVFSILGAFCLEALMRKDIGRFFKLFAVGIACALVSLLNPLGAGVYEAAERTLGGGLQKYIEEWQGFVKWQYLVYPVIASLLMLTDIKKQRRADLVIFFVWLTAGISAVRYMEIFALLTIPLVSKALHHRKFLNRLSESFEKDFSKSWLTEIFSLVAIAAVVVLYAIPKQLEFDASKYPVDETKYITEHFPHARVFNYYNAGGYIAYKTGGKVKTFIDGRAETAYPQAVVANFESFMNKHEGWMQVPNIYRADILMLPLNNNELITFKELGWQVLYKGRAAIILQNPAN